MKYFFESGYTSINKLGEELCGDKVEYITDGEFSTLVLADGLGSGVKANILATITSKILCTMVSNNMPLEECIETIVKTLPICKERNLAYSTFSIIHINNEGKGCLFEFDNPQAVFIHNEKCCDMERTKLTVCNKVVYKTELNLGQNDTILLMSDGTVHAGIGMLLNFGWQRKEIKEYLDKKIKPKMSARSIACLLASACNDLYLDKPGDDTTVAAIKLHKKLSVNIMVGPPIDKNKDSYYINQFVTNEGKKVVCGGTSSQIVAKFLKKELKTSFDFPDKDVPPIGFIDGIDLTTEGVLTLRRLLELSQIYLSTSDLQPKYYKKNDGASLLANLLFEEATHINFFVGQSVNIAHQGLPINTTMKLKLVESIAKNLKEMGKNISISYD